MRTPFRLLTITCTAALLFAACGGNDDTTTETPDTVATTTPVEETTETPTGTESETDNETMGSEETVTTTPLVDENGNPGMPSRAPMDTVLTAYIEEQLADADMDAEDESFGGAYSDGVTQSYYGAGADTMEGRWWWFASFDGSTGACIMTYIAPADGSTPDSKYAPTNVPLDSEGRSYGSAIVAPVGDTGTHGCPLPNEPSVTWSADKTVWNTVLIRTS